MLPWRLNVGALLEASAFELMARDRIRISGSVRYRVIVTLFVYVIWIVRILTVSKIHLYMPVIWQEGVVRHCEEPSVTFGRRCNLICHYYGLPRFARNDGVCSPDEATRNPGVTVCIAISRITFHSIRATGWWCFVIARIGSDRRGNLKPQCRRLLRFACNNGEAIVSLCGY